MTVLMWVREAFSRDPIELISETLHLCDLPISVLIPAYTESSSAATYAVKSNPFSSSRCKALFSSINSSKPFSLLFDSYFLRISCLFNSRSSMGSKERYMHFWKDLRFGIMC